MKKWFGFGSKKSKDVSKEAQGVPTKNSKERIPCDPPARESMSQETGKNERAKQSVKKSQNPDLQSSHSQVLVPGKTNAEGKVPLKESQVSKTGQKNPIVKEWNLSSSTSSERQSVSSNDEPVETSTAKEIREACLPALDPFDLDVKLESIVTDAMDYLANEGLAYPRLFREIAPRSESVILIHKAITNDEGKIDFIELNDARLAAGVLLACIPLFQTPIFPVSLFDLLVATMESARAVPIDERYQIWKNLITDSMALGRISPIFLNLLGLFHLVLEHTYENNVSSDLLELHFSPFFRPSQDSRIESSLDSEKYLINAALVLRELVSHIYQIFPDKVFSVVYLCICSNFIGSVVVADNYNLTAES